MRWRRRRPDLEYPTRQKTCRDAAKGSSVLSVSRMTSCWHAVSLPLSQITGESLCRRRHLEIKVRARHPTRRFRASNDIVSALARPRTARRRSACAWLLRHRERPFYVRQNVLLRYVLERQFLSGVQRTKIRPRDLRSSSALCSLFGAFVFRHLRGFLYEHVQRGQLDPRRSGAETIATTDGRADFVKEGRKQHR